MTRGFNVLIIGQFWRSSGRLRPSRIENGSYHQQNDTNEWKNDNFGLINPTAVNGVENENRKNFFDQDTFLEIFLEVKFV